MSLLERSTAADSRSAGGPPSWRGTVDGSDGNGWLEGGSERFGGAVGQHTSRVFYITFKEGLYDMGRPKSMRCTMAEVQQPSPLAGCRSLDRVDWGLPMLQADVGVLWFAMCQPSSRTPYRDSGQPLPVHAGNGRASSFLAGGAGGLTVIWRGKANRGVTQSRQMTVWRAWGGSRKLFTGGLLRRTINGGRVMG